MTLLQVATYAFAVIGVASVVYFAKKLFLARAGDDGPIRVKGGSVIVENDEADWELDPGGGAHRKYKIKKPKKFKVKVWKDESKPEPPLIEREAERVIVDVAQSMADHNELTFSLNREVFLDDRDNHLVAAGATLEDAGTDVRIRKIKFIPGAGDDLSFDPGQKPYMVLTPIP